MKRWGARRASGARHRSDAGNATGVATAVLALLSAGALATLGLVSAGEIAGDLGRGLGLGPGSGRVERPGGVVVSGPTGGSGDTGGSGGASRSDGGSAGPDLLVPAPGAGGVALPSPSGLTASPDASAPTPDTLEPPPVVQPLPSAEPSVPPPATPTVRVAPGRGRSAAAPGHVRRTPGPTLFAAPGPRGKPAPLASPQDRGRSGSAPGRLRPAPTGPTGPAAPTPPVVVPNPIPTPVAELVTGGVPGPPGRPAARSGPPPGQDGSPGQAEAPGRP